MTSVPGGAQESAVRAPAWVMPAAWAGIAVRLLLVLVSTGSNDIRLWEWFGREVFRSGVGDLYRADPLFNHPPLAGLYGAGAWALSQAAGIQFPVVFKLPLVAADAIALVLLRRWTAARRGDAAGAWAALVWGWAPSAILLCGLHGNLDPLCAALTFGSVFLVHWRRLPFLGGLCFAAALNVKLVPLVAAPALLVLTADRRGFVRFVAGAGLGVLPIAVCLAVVGEPMARNVLGWTGMPELWGLFGAARPLAQRLAPEFPSAPGAVEAAAHAARFAIFAAAIAMAVHSRLTGRRRDPRLPALCFTGLLLLAPGFGIQWLEHGLLLFLLVDLAAGAVYAAVSGAFLAIVYAGFVITWWPVTTRHVGSYGAAGVVLGALTWITLAWVALRLWRLPDEPGGTDAAGPSPPSGG